MKTFKNFKSGNKCPNYPSNNIPTLSTDQLLKQAQDDLASMERMRDAEAQRAEMALDLADEATKGWCREAELLRQAREQIEDLEHQVYKLRAALFKHGLVDPTAEDESEDSNSAESETSDSKSSDNLTDSSDKTQDTNSADSNSDTESDTDPEKGSGDDVIEVKGYTRKAPQHRPRNEELQKQLESLPDRNFYYRLKDETCRVCGHNLEFVKFEKVRDGLGVVPAQFFHDHIYQAVYKCTDCSGRVIYVAANEDGTPVVIEVPEGEYDRDAVREAFSQEEHEPENREDPGKYELVPVPKYELVSVPKYELVPVPKYELAPVPEIEPGIHFERTPVPRNVIPGSNLATFSLLEWLFIQRYVLGIPCNRMVDLCAFMGYALTRSKISSFLIHIGLHLFGPLTWYWRRHVLIKNTHIHPDETYHPVHRMKNDDLTPKKNSSNGFLWSAASGIYEDKRVCSVNYRNGRSQRHPRELFRDYHGNICIDGYKGYNSWIEIEGISVGRCWHHWFCDVKAAVCPSTKKSSRLIIYQLYMKMQEILEIDRNMPKDDSWEERLEYRRRYLAEPVLQLFDWCRKEIADHSDLMTKSCREAIMYGLNDEEGFCMCLVDPDLPLYNETIEQQFRIIANHRKSILFCDSPKGAEAMAINYSVRLTFRLNDMNIYQGIGPLMFELAQLALPDYVKLRDQAEKEANEEAEKAKAASLQAAQEEVEKAKTKRKKASAEKKKQKIEESPPLIDYDRLEERFDELCEEAYAPFFDDFERLSPWSDYMKNLCSQKEEDRREEETHTILV